MKAKKKNYEAPMIEVVPVEMEGVIASSDAGASLPPIEGTEISSSTIANPASLNDIGDLVEQLFTIED